MRRDCKDLTGQKFGRLTVTGYAGPNKSRSIMWYCDCDCGTKGILVSGQYLRDGRVKSCGCLKREIWSRIGKNNLNRGAKHDE